MTPRNLGTLLQRQSHESCVAARADDPQERVLATVLLQLVDALLQIGGVRNAFLRHFVDHIAGAEPVVGGERIGIDTSNHHTPDAVLDLVALAQSSDMLASCMPRVC